jgi:hypothetical protein
MQATGQNNSPNIILRHQEPVVSMVITRIKNPVMTLRLVLLQSIAGQFYDNCAIVITQTIVQLIRLQSSLMNIQTICTLKISEEQCRYILLIHASIAFMVHYYQSSRIMERLS